MQKCHAAKTVSKIGEREKVREGNQEERENSSLSRINLVRQL